jgi:hypothetical protein
MPIHTIYRHRYHTYIISNVCDSIRTAHHVCSYVCAHHQQTISVGHRIDQTISVRHDLLSYSFVRNYLLGTTVGRYSFVDISFAVDPPTTEAPTQRRIAIGSPSLGVVSVALPAANRDATTFGGLPQNGQ